MRNQQQSLSILAQAVPSPQDSAGIQSNCSAKGQTRCHRSPTRTNDTRAGLFRRKYLVVNPNRKLLTFRNRKFLTSGLRSFPRHGANSVGRGRIRGLVAPSTPALERVRLRPDYGAAGPEAAPPEGSDGECTRPAAPARKRPRLRCDYGPRKPARMGPESLANRVPRRPRAPARARTAVPDI